MKTDDSADTNQEKIAMTPQITNARTPEEWALLISEKWQDSVKGILGTGLLLANAKEELGQAEFWVMVRDNLKFHKQTVRKLMVVGTDPRLMECAHARIPASWYTLYELTRLTDEQFDRGIKSGAIHAGMERKDVAALKPPKEKKVKKVKNEPPKLTGKELITQRTVETRDQLISVLNELDKPKDQLDYITMIRFQLDELEAKRKEA